jgi:hypothetical protein
VPEQAENRNEAVNIERSNTADIIFFIFGPLLNYFLYFSKYFWINQVNLYKTFAIVEFVC